MEEVSAAEYLLQDPFLNLSSYDHVGASESPILLKNEPSTPTFFSVTESIISVELSSTTPTPIMSSQQQQQQQQQLIGSSSNNDMMKQQQQALNSTLYQPQTDPQTQMHFMNLLSQIKQQAALSSYQTNHDFINAQTAAAVAAQQPSTNGIRDQSSASSSSSSPSQSSVMVIQPTDNNNNSNNIDNNNNSCNNNSNNNSNNGNDCLSPIQQHQNVKNDIYNTTTATEATLTISMPTKKNIKASAIASPPNSPRKRNTTNSKLKHKTAQVQQHIQSQIQQQALSPRGGSSTMTTPTTPSAINITINNNNGGAGINVVPIQPPVLKLSNSPPSSSPPQSPITPPQPPPLTTSSNTNINNNNKTTKRGGSKSKNLAAPTGPNVINIINQLGLPYVNNNNNNNQTNNTNNQNNGQTSPRNSADSPPNVGKSSDNVGNGAAPQSNEDKKHICLSFLKYFFNVNPTIQTPNLRRSLILSLYVNKIPIDQRYRRPNDMANLCVVLYGYLFQSLDENTIREFVNSNSSTTQRFKKDDKKRKRKNNNKDDSPNTNGAEKSMRSPLNRSVTSKSAIQPQQLDLNNSGTMDTTGELNVTSPDNLVMSPTNSIESPKSDHATNNNNDDGEEGDITLHEAFINCVKACNLLPFIEFKPVHELQPSAEFPSMDHYYSYDDLIRWENELKDLKLSVKNSNQQQQQQQQQQPKQIISPVLIGGGLSSSIGQLNPLQTSYPTIQPLFPQHQQIQSPSSLLPSPLYPLNDDPAQWKLGSILENQTSTNLNSISNNSSINNLPIIQNNTINSISLNNSNSGIVCSGNAAMVNVFENEESYIIYVAVPHSRPNSLRVTVNQMEVIVEGTVIIPETIFLPNGTEMALPVPSFPNTFTKQEFFVGPFTKHIPLSSPVSSSVVGKKEGIVVVIARKMQESSHINCLN